MRTKAEIHRDYLLLLNEEKNLGYSETDIDDKLNNEYELEAVKTLLDKELKSTEEIMIDVFDDKGHPTGQKVKATVSSRRAWYIFCDIIVRYAGGDSTGERIWNTYVKMFFPIVEHNKFSAQMVLRGGGKTFNWGLYYVLKGFLISRFKMLYVAGVPNQVKDYFRNAEDIVDTNEMLIEKKDRSNLRELTWCNKEMEYNGGYCRGITIGTTPRGNHVHLCVIDDVITEGVKYSDEHITNYILGSSRQTILRHRGRMGVTNTPQHEADPMHVIMNEKLNKTQNPIGKLITNGRISYAGFYSIVLPGVTDWKNKKVLIPEVHTFDEFMRERANIGEARFQREIQCTCVSMKGSMISSSLFRRCCDDTLSCIQAGQHGRKYIVVVDSATSDSQTADFFAATVFEEYEKKLILRHLVHKKGFPMYDPDGGNNDQPNCVYQLHKDFNNAKVVIEKNNAGIALIQGLRARFGVEAIEHYTHSNLHETKIKDIDDYVQALKDKNIVFPSNPDDLYTLNILEKIKSEHLAFGVKKKAGKEVYEALSGHDDAFDTCWLGWRYRDARENDLPLPVTIGNTPEAVIDDDPRFVIPSF